MNKIRKSIFVCCLLWIFVLTGLVACGGGEGVKVNSANALARKLASDSAIKINLSKDIFLEEPVIVNGEKEIVGNGKIIATVEGGEENYMLTVANGGKLTVGGSVKIDASGLLGGIHVQENGAAVIAEKAVVMNASEITANALVEGSFHVQGGTLKEANGHNIYNKNETIISGGEIVGSGDKYAGVYNEGTLSQTGGSVTNAYNNISNMSGSVFTFEGGTNTKSIRDGIFIAEGASLKATKKDAVIEEAGGRGILLHGKADIKAITVKSCSDTLIKVGKRGVLNLGNGILQEGNYHGVDNAGTMTMMGGNIQMNKNCGIVNTGSLKVSGGNIANNENKGILNKHKGKADVTSAMVNFTSNKIAIANEDKAEFEFAKAKILMSTQTNVYCYDGTINLHDISLNASTSNNVRVIDGVVNMTNVEVKGNSQKSNASHHGMMLEGGEVIAENVTVSMTTGCGMRVKGGAFKGKNIKMHDINRTAISMSKPDYLDVEGLVDIKGLEIESVNYNNVLNEGGGTIKITNGKLAVASSNSVRSDDGRTELTNVTVPGHKKESVNYIYGIYMEGGDIVAKNVTVQNTTGGALRVKHGKFAGNNIKILNAKGDSAISNLPLNDDVKDGIIEIDGLTMKNSFSKNITLDSGVTIIKNAKLGPTGGNNIKMNNNAATLKLYNVDIEGQRNDAAKSTHGIMVEGGNVFGEKVRITNALTCGIRSKWGVVDLKDVTMTKLGAEGISCGKMFKDKVELGAGKVKIDGLTIKQAGTKNIDLDAGTVHIINADLEKIATNNHNVKVGGTGLIIMENTKIHGTSDTTKYSIIAEGGDVELNNVEISDSAKSAIHINKDSSSVKGKNIVIQKAVEGITGYRGEVTLKTVELSEISTNGMNVGGGVFTIDGLRTSGVGEKNVIADGDVKVTVLNGDLCATAKHNVQSNGKDSKLTLKKVTINGVTSDGQYGIIAEKGGNVALDTVTVKNVKANAIHINTAESTITGKNVIVEDSNVGINASHGTVELTVLQVSNTGIAVNAWNTKHDADAKLTITGLTTENIKQKNVVADGTTNVEIVNGILSATGNHNVQSNGKDSKLTLKKVTINGVTSDGQYGIIAEKGGNVALDTVTVKNVKANAIHINTAESTITGKNVIVEDSNVGINASHGTVELTVLQVSNTGIAVNAWNPEHDADAKLTITGLTTENIKQKNVVADGTTNVEIVNGILSATGNHNVQSNGKDSKLTLKKVTINGVTSDGQYGIIAEKGGNVALDTVTVKNVKANAIHINTTESTITGKNVIVEDSNVGINASHGTVELTALQISNTGIAVNAWNPEHDADAKLTITGLTTENIKQKNVVADGTTNVEIVNGILSATGNHNVQSNGKDSKLTLKKVTISGVTSDGQYGIIAEKGGDVALNDVSIENVKANAIHINTAESEITGKNVTVLNANNGIFASQGKVELTTVDISETACAVNGTGGSIKVTGLITEKIANNNIFAGDDNAQKSENQCEITIEDGELCKTVSGHNVKSTMNGKVVLNDVQVKGTEANDKYGVMAEGGDAILNDVTISDVAKIGIFVNTDTSSVKASDVTITGCAEEGIKNVGGEVEIENVDTTGVTGTGIKSNVTLKVAGEVKSYILLEEPVSVEATKALTGSVFTIDWVEGKIPTDSVAIQFTGENAVEATKATKADSTITFGANANIGYVPYFYGTQLLLNDRSNIQYTVKNFAELQEAMTEINTRDDINTATITVIGEITATELITVKEGKTVCIQDDQNVRTIKRGADYHEALFQVEVTASLTFGGSSADNENVTLIVDGGSKDGITNEDACSLVDNKGTLTVTRGVKLANNSSSGNNRGLGIYAGSGSTTTFRGILENIVGTSNGTNGSAIVVNGTTVNLTDAIIKNNSTNGRGAIQVTENAMLVAKNTLFEGNKAASDGGAIYVSGDDAKLSAEGCTFRANEAKSCGGAISIEQKKENAVIIRNSIFENNKAENEGSSINVPTDCLITLESCQFTGGITKANDTTNSISGFGDVRVADNRNAGGIKISGKMVVDIYMNQAGKIDLVGDLTKGSKVIANWRIGEQKKISGNTFEGFTLENVEDITMLKDYVSLSNNYNTSYILKFEAKKGTLVKVDVLEAANEDQLKQCINSITNTGVVKLTDSFTMSNTITIPKDKDITIVDNNKTITITRVAEAKNKKLFDVKSGATLTLLSSSKDNENASLKLDGGSKSGVINTDGCTIVHNEGNVFIGRGVELANNECNNDRQGFGVYSASGSETVFGGVISNIKGTHSNTKGSAIAVMGRVYMKDAVVKNCEAKLSGVIRVSDGTLQAVDSEFKFNKSGDSAAAILVENSGTATISKCNFNNNEAGKNGGALAIRKDKQGTVIITDTVFEKNKTTGNGGAISSEENANGSMTITGCSFLKNEAGGNGGAVTIESKSTVIFSVNDCKFSENKANEGGAINMATGVTITLSSCEFAENTTKSQNKGDVRVANNKPNYDNGGGEIRISGKMNVTIFLNQAGAIKVVGALTEGSEVIANWRSDRLPEVGTTGIVYGSADIANDSAKYITLGSNHVNDYKIVTDGTNGIIQKK